MNTVEELIEQVCRLPLADRRRGVEAVEESLAEEVTLAQEATEGPYARSLALAGTVHTECTDVSADKYKYLADAYASRTEEP